MGPRGALSMVLGPGLLELTFWWVRQARRALLVQEGRAGAVEAACGGRAQDRGRGGERLPGGWAWEPDRRIFIIREGKLFPTKKWGP